jgi:hypothetical protein
VPIPIADLAADTLANTGIARGAVKAN